MSNKANKEPRLGKEVWRELKSIQAYGYSPESVFIDFFDTVLYSLLSLTTESLRGNAVKAYLEGKVNNEYESKYLELVGKYRENKTKEKGERPIDNFANAWGLLVKETHALDQDVIGSLYEDQITHGQNGQFFTPNHVSDLMAKITGADKTVSDPCCGSGRFFISAGKINPNTHFIGVDNDRACVKMTAINMWLFDLNADIYHGDSLTNERYDLYKTRKGGYIYWLK